MMEIGLADVEAVLRYMVLFVDFSYLG